MVDSIELDADLADDLRAEARIRGFADAESYLTWIVNNRVRLFQNDSVVDRLDDIERRLAAVEAAVPTNGDGSYGDDDVTDIIDDALEAPTGADDDDVAAAISDTEDDS